MFKRRKGDSPGDAPGDAPGEPEGVEDDGDGSADEDRAQADEGEAGLTPRPNGPWDDSEVEDPEPRLDLGGVWIRGFDGLHLQVQMDESTGVVSVVTLTRGDAALQIQAFAAPRSAGIWPDVRAQLVGSITSSGGLVEEAPGEFGVELRARVPGQGGALQPARFVGVDGPRWFLRGLYLGSAAAPGGAPDLEDAFRDIVVVRGQDAMAPGDLITMTLPPEAQATRM